MPSQSVDFTFDGESSMFTQDIFEIREGSVSGDVVASSTDGVYTGEAGWDVNFNDNSSLTHTLTYPDTADGSYYLYLQESYGVGGESGETSFLHATATLSPTVVPEPCPPGYTLVGETCVLVEPPDPEFCDEGSEYNPETETCDPVSPPYCTYSLTPSSSLYGPEAGSGSCTMNTGETCRWTPATNDVDFDNFLTIDDLSERTGPGTVGYTFPINLGPGSRGSAITSRGQSHTVVQEGPAEQDDCPDGYVYNPETETCDPVTGPTDVAWPFDGICEGTKTTLTWNTVEGAESYRVERQGPGDADFLPIGNTDELFFIDTDVTIGLSYDYRVIAEFDSYESLPSEVLTVEPCTGFITTGPTEPPTGTETLCTGQATGFTAYCSSDASGYEVVETY